MSSSTAVDLRIPSRERVIPELFYPDPLNPDIALRQATIPQGWVTVTIRNLNVINLPVAPRSQKELPAILSAVQIRRSTDLGPASDESHAGSGVLLKGTTDDIITCYHVIGPAGIGTLVYVQGYWRGFLPAVIVYIDPALDLALLRIDRAAAAGLGAVIFKVLPEFKETRQFSYTDPQSNEVTEIIEHDVTYKDILLAFPLPPQNIPWQAIDDFRHQRASRPNKDDPTPTLGDSLTHFGFPLHYYTGSAVCATATVGGAQDGGRWIMNGAFNPGQSGSGLYATAPDGSLRLAGLVCSKSSSIDRDILAAHHTVQRAKGFLSFGNNDIFAALSQTIDHVHKYQQLHLSQAIPSSHIVDFLDRAAEFEKQSWASRAAGGSASTGVAPPIPLTFSTTPVAKNFHLRKDNSLGFPLHGINNIQGKLKAAIDAIAAQHLEPSKADDVVKLDSSHAGHGLHIDRDVKVKGKQQFLKVDIQDAIKPKGTGTTYLTVMIDVRLLQLPAGAGPGHQLVPLVHRSLLNVLERKSAISNNGALTDASQLKVASAKWEKIDKDRLQTEWRGRTVKMKQADEQKQAEEKNLATATQTLEAFAEDDPTRAEYSLIESTARTKYDEARHLFGYHTALASIGGRPDYKPSLIDFLIQIKDAQGASFVHVTNDEGLIDGLCK